MIPYNSGYFGRLQPENTCNSDDSGAPSGAHGQAPGRATRRPREPAAGAARATLRI
ncbi:hypothetical protein CBM2634_A10198 [Cupriavidus taiwanensis]|uniref:Uncharacterized protein n=1 Tax=Cupriavidus taiwanensis TaxID=164546 RepID=A0A375ITR9_9BURK|nr:hypothetical protein CBM2634_A10198 [Cupriavidus taiwanensis]